MSGSPPGDHGVGEQGSRAIHVDQAQGALVGDTALQSSGFSITAGGDAFVAGRDIHVRELHVHGAHAVAAVPAAPAQSASIVAAPANADCPPGLVNLPERPVLFVGRLDELGQLDKALTLHGEVVVQAVHGLGGIGKSTLAARWAMLNAARYNPVWWISADTQASVDSGLAALALALDQGLSRVLAPESLREWAVQWLVAHQGWLVILDNVNDPAKVKTLLARVTTGRFLITSRRATGWHGIATPVELGVMTESEATELLTAIVASRRTADLAGATELCRELGYLPLAIEQAGAYITETGLTPRAYMDLMAKYPAEVYRSTAEGGDASRTIARIWDITLARLADEPLASEVLLILAWYAPDDIPRSIFDGSDQQFDVIRAIGRLAAYSMITIEHDYLTVHRLVQAIARTPSADSQSRSAENIAGAQLKAIALLEAALPGEGAASWLTWESLLPHVDALASRVAPESDTAHLMNIITRAALFRIEAGSEGRAIAYLERALDSCQRVLGQNHRDTMTCWNNLAFAYQSAGELGIAIPLYEQNLDDQVQRLGSEHPDALTSRNNLAYAYQLDGSLTWAISLYERNLEDRIRILGPDHPHTLTSRNNLANAYKSAGDLTRAITLYERNLQDRIRILGPDHRHTLTSRNNLANACMSAGDLTRAITLFKQNMDAADRALPRNNPISQSARNCLAVMRWVYGIKLAIDLLPVMPRETSSMPDLVHGDIAMLAFPGRDCARGNPPANQVQKRRRPASPAIRWTHS